MTLISEFVTKIQTIGLEALGKYYSSYRGFVTDNEDPEGHGRVKVLVPQVYGPDSSGAWAYPKGMGSHGAIAQNMPDYGDMVWVEFEAGNPAQPMWSLGYPLVGKLPEEFKNTKLFGYKTLNGHSITVDDLTDTILIKHNDGNEIKITKEDIVFNQGTEGITILSKLVARLNDYEKELGEIKSKYNAHTHPVAGALAGVITDPLRVITYLVPDSKVSDFEDTKIKH